MQAENEAVILIATPASGSLLTSDYVRSIFSLQRECFRRGRSIDFRLQIGAFSILEKARNVAASCVYNDRTITHLLFIDADQGFEPDLILDMIAFNKAVVSAVVPRRYLDVEDTYNKARRLDNFDDFKAKMMQFVAPSVVREDDGGIRIIKGFIRVNYIGTGVMLIQREAIERLAAIPEIVARHGALGIPDMVSGDYIQCFRSILKHDNTPLSEDLSFCHRWVHECGGEIWANVTRSVTHVGLNSFQGKFIDQLR